MKRKDIRVGQVVGLRPNRHSADVWLKGVVESVKDEGSLWLAVVHLKASGVHKHMGCFVSDDGWPNELCLWVEDMVEVPQALTTLGQGLRIR